MVTETDFTAQMELPANHFTATKASLISMAVRHDSCRKDSVQYVTNTETGLIKVTVMEFYFGFGITIIVSTYSYLSNKRSTSLSFFAFLHVPTQLYSRYFF